MMEIYVKIPRVIVQGSREHHPKIKRVAQGWGARDYRRVSFGGLIQGEMVEELPGVHFRAACWLEDPWLPLPYSLQHEM